MFPPAARFVGVTHTLSIHCQRRTVIQDKSAAARFGRDRALSLQTSQDSLLSNNLRGRLSVGGQLALQTDETNGSAQTVSSENEVSCRLSHLAQRVQIPSQPFGGRRSCRRCFRTSAIPCDSCSRIPDFP